MSLRWDQRLFSLHWNNFWDGNEPEDALVKVSEPLDVCFRKQLLVLQMEISPQSWSREVHYLILHFVHIISLLGDVQVRCLLRCLARGWFSGLKLHVPGIQTGHAAGQRCFGGEPHHHLRLLSLQPSNRNVNNHRTERKDQAKGSRNWTGVPQSSLRSGPVRVLL